MPAKIRWRGRLLAAAQPYHLRHIEDYILDRWNEQLGKSSFTKFQPKAALIDVLSKRLGQHDIETLMIDL
jgi:hypothetical protein